MSMHICDKGVCYVSERLNVILVALDTTRADRLSCYGHERLTSPHIDRVASQGVIFAECFSPYIPTHPGFTSMFTGKDVIAHQISTQGGRVDLDESCRQLQELLREAGYFTAAADNLGRWFRRGFDVYEGYSWDTDPKKPWRKAEAVNETALRLLNLCVSQSKPFFLFLHYWDPHTPYLPPPPFSHMFYQGDEKDPNNKSMEPVLNFPPFSEYFRKWMGDVTDIEFPKAQYDAEIAYMDSCLAHLFTHMDALGLTDNTLLIITADHGEELDEHQLWFDHHGLYDTNTHVPLILKCPSKLPAGKRIYGFVTLMDIAPTVLDFLGLGELAERECMQGRSLLPLIHADSPISSGTCDEIYMTESTWMKKRALRTHQWLYIQETGETPQIYNKPGPELYNLRDDPQQLHNLADELPEVVRELDERICEWVKRRKRETGLPDPFERQSITYYRISETKTAIPKDQ